MRRPVVGGRVAPVRERGRTWWLGQRDGRAVEMSKWNCLLESHILSLNFIQSKFGSHCQVSSHGVGCGWSDHPLMLLRTVGSRAGRVFPYRPGRKCWQIPSQQRLRVLAFHQGFLKDLGFKTQFPYHIPPKPLASLHLHHPQDRSLTTSQGSCSSLPGTCILPVDFCFLALFDVH